MARCAGYTKAEARERTDRALERTGLTDVGHRKTKGFSKGMRQRTRLAAGLVHDPDLLLLDEPMTGLDPVGRRDVVRIVREFAEEGRSVIFSSHILHEVEAVANYVVVLAKGMLLAEGTRAHIRECLRDHDFTLEVRCSDPRRLAEALAPRPHVASLAFPDQETLVVSTTSSGALASEIPKLMLDLDLEVFGITSPNESLESLFRKLVR